MLDFNGRVRAEQNRPPIDVYCSNMITDAQGTSDGIFEPLDPKIATNPASIYDTALMPQNLGAKIEFNDLGLWINKKAYLDNKNALPTSWADFCSPAVAGRVIMDDTTDFSTQLYLAYIGGKLGGHEDDPTKAIELVASEKSKLLAVVRTYRARERMLKTGQAWAMISSGLTSWPGANSNPDPDFVSPKEGPPLYSNGIHVVKGAPNPLGAIS